MFSHLNTYLHTKNVLTNKKLVYIDGKCRKPTQGKPVRETKVNVLQFHTITPINTDNKL